MLVESQCALGRRAVVDQPPEKDASVQGEVEPRARVAERRTERPADFRMPRLRRGDARNHQHQGGRGLALRGSPRQSLKCATEPFCEALKGELGLNHFEGNGSEGGITHPWRSLAPPVTPP